MEYINWINYIKTINSSDGKPIEIYEFNHQQNNDALSEWATYFRNIYCEDSMIDRKKKPKESRQEYLLKTKFPREDDTTGPATRSGDFAEILMGDILEFKEKYWVPRVRYNRKANPSMSTPGSDVIAIKLSNNENDNDELLVFEVKAAFSEGKAEAKLVNAIQDSKKDFDRIGESLNFIKERFIDLNKNDEESKITRIQEYLDNSGKLHFGAAAFYTETKYDEAQTASACCTNHPNKDDLRLVVVKGKQMMKLVHSLYQRAANEA